MWRSESSYIGSHHIYRGLPTSLRLCLFDIRVLTFSLLRPQASTVHQTLSVWSSPVQQFLPSALKCSLFFDFITTIQPCRSFCGPSWLMWLSKLDCFDRCGFVPNWHLLNGGSILQRRDFIQCRLRSTSSNDLQAFIQVDNGYLEAIVRGYKAGILSQNQYANLAQCETLEGNTPNFKSTIRVIYNPFF